MRGWVRWLVVLGLVLVLLAANGTTSAQTAISPSLPNPSGTIGEPADPVSGRIARTPDDPTPPAADADLGSQRLAAAAALLSKHAVGEVEALRRLASVDVINPFPGPNPAVVAANATATASAEARATADAEAQATVQALAAQPTATMEPTPTATAPPTTPAAMLFASPVAATPSVIATPIAVGSSSQPMQATPAAPPVPAPVASVSVNRGDPAPPFSPMLSRTLIGIGALLPGVLGLVFWRNRREPFVIKAKPARA